MRLAVPDLVSNSYFPAIAASELGFFEEEGVASELSLRFPVTQAARDLLDGKIDFLAGAAHAPFYMGEQFRELKLVAALSQKTYWKLVVRAESSIEVGDIAAIRDMRIGAADGVDVVLRQLIEDFDVDLEEANIVIGPVAGTDAGSVSFGVTAADALEAGTLDAFWANGMGAAVATARGVGKVIYDARRSGGAPASFTFPALIVRASKIEEEPDEVGSVLRAILRAQHELIQDPSRATVVGEALFPAMEAGMIAQLIRDDAPFYSPRITPEATKSLISFSQKAGLLESSATYDDVVARLFRPKWEITGKEETQ